MQRLSDYALRLPVLGQSATARQLVKFLLVGVTNTFWDYALYIVLTRGLFGFTLYYLAAQLIAFIGSVLNSYFFNKRWTFRNKDPRHHIQISKFFLVNIITLGIYEMLLFFLVEKLEMFDLLAKALVIIPVTLWNFFANKYWTFKKGPERENLQKA